MKKICSLPFAHIFFLMLFFNGCFDESGLPILGIHIVLLLAIISYSLVLMKKNRNYSSLNKDLAQIISIKIEELETINLNIESQVLKRTADLSEEKDNALQQIKISNDLNTNLHDEINQAKIRLMNKNDLMLLNSRLATMGEMIGFIGH